MSDLGKAKENGCGDVVGQVSDDAQFRPECGEIEFQGVALVNDELFLRELSPQALDDIAIDLDHVQRLDDLTERRRYRGQPRPDLHHTVGRRWRNRFHYGLYDRRVDQKILT